MYNSFGKQFEGMRSFYRPIGRALEIFNFLPGSWDITNASLNAPIDNRINILISSKPPETLLFKPDGTKMYLLDADADRVVEYDLSTPWDIETAVYLQVFAVGSQESRAAGACFKPDGTKMYITGNGGDAAYEYDLSTAWDISTSVYLQSFSVSAIESSPEGIQFKPDGTKMYIQGRNDLYEYYLSTPWDISTSVYLQQLYTRSIIGPQVTSFFFKPDGSKLYFSDDFYNRITEYDLSTPWDISTGTKGDIFEETSKTEPHGGFFIKPDGTKLYALSNKGGFEALDVYDLSTPWDLSDVTNGPTYTANFLDTAPQNILTPTGLSFKTDGTKLYVLSFLGTSSTINEYDLSTPWDIYTGVYLQSFSIAAQERSPEGLFFKPDGTKMYICGTFDDEVDEYDLSTPWDISTSVYLQSFSLAAQEISPAGIFFKSDGRKMYVVGYTSDAVQEYKLSTAWDISTSVYLQSFSLAAEDITPVEVFFRQDGLKMYMFGQSRDRVYEYNLSKAWDISTLAVNNFYSVSTVYETAPLNSRGFYFKPDGTSFYMAGPGAAGILAFDINIA